MLIECPELAIYRNACTLGGFVKTLKRVMPSISPVKIYAHYLPDSHPEDINEKAFCLYSMKTAWDQKVKMLESN